MKYCGIDLHSNNSVVSVIDEADHVGAERRLPNELARIVAFLAGWKDELAGIVVESTYNWYWLVDGLQAEGFTVHLAHTTAIKKYEGLKHSGDETDARYLAHLLRLGILPTGTILPPEARNLRDLARKRMQLVRSRTMHILAVENITARQFGRRITSNQVCRLDEAAISQMGLPEDVILAVRANVATITTLDAQIASSGKSGEESQSRTASDRAGHRPDSGNGHPARGRPCRTLCQSRKLCFVCAVRRQRAHKQRQEERRR